MLDITVLTGFLGAGKTSLLRQLLKLDGWRDAQVIINEIGEQSIDHLLVERLDDEIHALADGCICCSSNSALSDLISARLSQIPPIAGSSIVIETSGVTDVAAMLQHLVSHPQLVGKIKVQTVCVVSAIDDLDVRLCGQEALNQIAMADLLLVAKTDLLDENNRDTKIAHLASQLKIINPLAKLAFLPASDEGLHCLFAEPQFRTDFSTGSSTASHAHAHKFNNLLLTHSVPIKTQAVQNFVEKLQSEIKRDLLRLKGLVFAMENPLKPTLVQTVGASELTLTQLPSWPHSQETALIAIFKGNHEAYIRDQFAAWCAVPNHDQPDYQAVEESPLSVTGMGVFTPRSRR